MTEHPFPDPVPVPITGDLDLHTFSPKDVSSLLPEYFAECRKRGILAVRVVHGKGTGALRTHVHRVLDKLPQVQSWTWPAGVASGGWGATWVYLSPGEGRGEEGDSGGPDASDSAGGSGS